MERDFLFRKKLKVHIFQMKSVFTHVTSFYPPLLVFTPPFNNCTDVAPKTTKNTILWETTTKRAGKNFWVRSRTFDLKSMNLQFSLELKILRLAQKLTKIDSVEKCEFSKFWRKNVNFLYLSFIHVTF